MWRFESSRPSQRSSDPAPIGVRYRDRRDGDLGIRGAAYVDSLDEAIGDYDIIDPASTAVAEAVDLVLPVGAR